MIVKRRLTKHNVLTVLIQYKALFICYLEKKKPNFALKREF